MQPNLIITPFGENADPGTIRAIPESKSPTDPRQDASWETGFPIATMTAISAGGIPPEGKDLNGVLNAISEHTAFIGGGGQYRWSEEYVLAKGGYQKGSVIQSDNGDASYVSDIDGNTVNFNSDPSSIGGVWKPYGGPLSADAIEAADRASQEADRSSEAADRSTDEASRAAYEASQAELYSQAALTHGQIKTTIAEGLTSGLDFFWVSSPDALNVVILYQNVSGVAVNKGSMPSAEFVKAVRLTSGDVFKSISTYGEALNGGVLIKDTQGRNVGLTIPAGQTGNASYVRAELGLQSYIPDLIGTKITVDVYFDATLNFVNDTVMTTTVMQVLRAGSVVTVTPESQSLTQMGGIIHKSITYTIRAGDSDVYPIFRPGVSTTAADRTAVMRSVIWAVGSPPVGFVTWSDFHLSLILAPMRTDIANNTITSGELVDGNLYLQNGEALNGAVRINDSSGGMIGLSVPAGFSGGASYVSPFFKVNGAGRAGSIIRVTAVFNATAGFLTACPPGTVALQVRRGGGSINVAPTNLRMSQTGTKVTKSFDYTLTVDDLAVAPTYQIISTTPVAGTVRSISIASIKYTLTNTPPGETPADIMLGIQLAAAVSRLGVTGPEKDVTVADSGGEFTTLAAANSASSGASVTEPVAILMMDSADVLNVNLNDRVSTRGNRAERVRLHHAAPANVDPALIPTFQVIRPEKNHHLENLRFDIENGRYPIHSDSGNSFKNGEIVVYNCDIEHLGNQSAQDYQNSLPGGGVTVWPSLHAWGYGASSGQSVLIENGRLKSPSSAYYMHTNRNFSKPSHTVIQGEVLIAWRDTGIAAQFQPLGSRQADTVTMRGNSINGRLYYWCNPWMQETLDYQPADHSEVKVFGYGNTPAVFEISEFGRALKIQSVTEGLPSKASVSGDAVPLIFGKENYSFDGCPGIKGYVYGYADISGADVGAPTVGNITSLGKRLGNCTVVNKTLNVLIDGVTTKTIVFNQDYTAQSNATILAAINAAMTGLAIATAYDIGGRYRPSFTDEELELVNATAEGIEMFMAVAYDNHHKKIRKMTATDDPSLFRGVTWADIYPSKSGRVKFRGYLSRNDLLGLSAATMTFGQPVYIDPAVPGRMTLTPGTNVIMRAISSDAVEVARK